MLTFDNFKAIFHRAKKTQWVLYKGSGKGTQIGSMLSENEIDADESLSELNDIISAYGDGIYTVECRGNRLASRGNDLHTFMYGDAEAAKATVGKAAAPVAHPASSFFAGLDAKYFMDQQASVQTQLQQMQLQLLRKEMEINNLKRDLKDAEKEDDSSIGSFLTKNPALINRALDVIAPGRPAVSGLKTTRPIPPQKPAEEVENDDDDYEDYETGKLDINALVDAAMRIQKALPGLHPNDVIDKIADYAENNPGQAENLLNMI